MLVFCSAFSIIVILGFSGISGCPLQAYIFMGPIYYQKLKHMVKLNFYLNKMFRVVMSLKLGILIDSNCESFNACNALNE